MEALRIRPASEAEISFLVDLRQQTMAAYQLAAGLVPCPEEQLRRVLHRFDCAAIVERAGQSIGLLKVLRDGLTWELLQIQLLPPFQGRGIGTMLIQSVIDEASAAKASLKLTVLKVNPAQHLYRRLGFMIVAEKDTSYEMEIKARLS